MLLPVVSAAQSTQSNHELPGEAVTLAALEQAERALRAYEDTLTKYKDLSVIAGTIGIDRQTVLNGGFAVTMVKVQLGTTPQKLDGTKLGVAFANVDRTALNASLTAGAAALIIDGPEQGDTIREDLAALPLRF